MPRKKKAGKRRGGRKPGTWSLLTSETLRAWRQQNSVSRAQVAAMLGVSSTSVQNWETGRAVASPKTQKRLLELTSGGVERTAGNGSAGPDRNGSKSAATPPSDGNVIQVTGSIVVEVVRSGGKKAFSPDAIGALIRAVRQALS